MRNTVLRQFHETLVRETNKALEQGIEPYALALALRMMGNQLDSLALDYERQEASQTQKAGGSNEIELEGSTEE